ncbi:flagellar protein FlaG [Cupriavidus oxalaticus]|uniref:FlaG: Flagellar protein n=1 Tax=Cupriavidus oxalaticus TaxID=96344 RepID=A0A976GCK8_9BURK|nr:flagellar protein FlaG [Cupriavidus oxalaticus]QRQ84688.1 flagellar protein FlaG [Cupriavidus oxalaticus]QRQ91223.1 flagellar protein FlaG [Cupriavidus oxalaticus]WQD85781.1 flagellar protein FlaG [Cupriavidus oxalaticus]SPC20698.1 FlaG: Flagellar protein [Cupriavidus oxalaticus]
MATPFPVLSSAALQPSEAPAAVASAHVATHARRYAAGTAPEATTNSADLNAGADSVALSELADALKATSIGLRFEIDEDTHRVITKVIDKETGELIRQMPIEEVLRIARAIDKVQGLFVRQSA